MPNNMLVLDLLGRDFVGIEKEQEFQISHT